MINSTRATNHLSVHRGFFTNIAVFALAFFAPFSVLAQQQSPALNSSDALFEQADFLPVEEAYQAIPSVDEGNTLRVDWQLRQSYYLYKSRFSTEILLGGEKIAIEPIYQAGIIKDDPYFGEVEVYYNETFFTAANFPKDQTLSLALTSQGCADAGLCYPPYTAYFAYMPETQRFISIDQASYEASADSLSKPSAEAEDKQSISLVWALLLALFGGIILNLMPCVFPVLGLKVLGLSNAPEGKALNHGLVYTLGVILSFVAVAATLIALKSAGQAIGWGFQLQNPSIVAILAAVFFLLGLNLLGLFEIGGGLMGAGDKLTKKSGYSGSFFTGVLAVVVATPCTAPFMGSALGFASTQPPLTAILVFISLGLGMALPVLLLVTNPAAMRKMPKPGAWMESFKQFLAFPLFATAVWLTWVIGKQIGSDGMGLILLSFVLLGFAVWLKDKGKLGTILMLATVIAVAYLFTTGLNRVQSTTSVNKINQGNSSTYLEFSPERLQQLVDAGEKVFLDVTAAWCITCKANESLVLNTEEVQSAFASLNVHYMVADWTNYDPSITVLLETYQRNGIPLYLWFDGSLNSAGEVLPQVLSKSIVLNRIHSQNK